MSAATTTIMLPKKSLVYPIFTALLAVSTCSVLANVLPESGAAASASSSVSGVGSTLMKTENIVSTTTPSAIEAGIMQVFNTKAPSDQGAAPSSGQPTPVPAVAVTVAPATTTPVTSAPSTVAPAASPAPAVASPAPPAAATPPASAAPNATSVSKPAAIAAAKKEEAALINEVVSKVLESDAKSIEKNTNINVFDVSSKSLAPASGTPNATGNPSSVPTVKGFLNDPNTLLVLVDDSKSNSTAPVLPVVPASAAATTIAPSVPLYNKTSTAALVNSIINDPKNDNKNISVIVEVFKTPTTVAPLGNVTKVVVTTTVKPIKAANSTTPTGSSSTNSTTSPSPTTKAPVTTVKPASTAAPTPSTTTTTTKKAKESLADMLKRHEKEKKEMEPKSNPSLKQKKQNEKDAHTAIKNLQAARSHSTDNKLHQLEHNRQMALDPIGHTLKHQQYELSKQRLLSGVK